MLISASAMEIIYTFARQTNPRTMSLEDVLFTGVLRVKANLSEPANVDNMSTHLLDAFDDKVIKLRSWQYIQANVCPSPIQKFFLIYKAIERKNAFDFCRNHFIAETQCLIDLGEDNEIDDDEPFFKQLERKVQTGKDGEIRLKSTLRMI